MDDTLTYHALFDAISPFEGEYGVTHALPAETFDAFTLGAGFQPLLDALRAYLLDVGDRSQSDPAPVDLGALFYTLGLVGISDVGAVKHRRDAFYAVLAVAAAANALNAHEGVQKACETVSDNLCHALVYLGNLTRGMGYRENIHERENRRNSGFSWSAALGLSYTDLRGIASNINKDNTASRSFALFQHLQRYWDRSQDRLQAPKVPSYLSDPGFVLGVAQRILTPRRLDASRSVRVFFGALPEQKGEDTNGDSKSQGYSFAFTLKKSEEVASEEQSDVPQVVLDPASCHLLLTAETDRGAGQSAGDHAGQPVVDIQNSFEQVLTRIPQAVFRNLRQNEVSSRALQHRWALGIDLVTSIAHAPTTLTGASATMAAATVFACAWANILHDDRVAVLAQVAVDEVGKLFVEKVDDEGLKTKIQALARDTHIDTVLIHPENVAAAETACQAIVDNGGVKIAVRVVDAKNPLGTADHLHDADPPAD